jgi:hypothetical protein
MTNQEINETIAKACGWRRVDIFEWDGSFCLPKQYVELSDLPNYVEDLNATHEAEKTLNKHQACLYLTHLNDLHKSLFECFVHATAEQRAEAFLRTLNLWKE